MTDFDRIKEYYSVFDEQHRLEKSEGRLEYEMALPLVLQHINKDDNILDLGGGAGRYSIELAKMGYKVTLADLSECLLEQAKNEIESNKLPPLQSIDAVNAVDLSRYDDESFDAVILFGPLYHLLEESERIRCVSEVFRVLRKDGVVVASFIPYLSGADGILSRALIFPDQVDENNLSRVFRTGKFNNNASIGFQEGYYPQSAEIESLFGTAGFTKVLMRSIRGLGCGKEERLYVLQSCNAELFDEIIGLLNETADNPAVIETCGHAVYIGRK